MTVPLHELAAIVRSKNAGPYRLTIDVLFNDQRVFQFVRDVGALSPERVADAFGLSLCHVTNYVVYPAALAIKITFKRPVVAGSRADSDVYGCQQHSPLLSLTVPSPPDS